MLSRTSWSQFLGGCLLLISSPYLVLAANHDVNVAQTGLTYSPDHLDSVAAQDTVTFHFLSGPHSATQGSLQSPCSALSGGFDSGLLPTGSSNTFQITVSDTNPLWFHCKVSGHCQSGMVFAVNANATALAQFQAAATGNTPSTSASSSSSSRASSSTSSSAPTINNGYGGSGFVSKSIAGGVGVAALVSIIGVLML